MSLGGCYAYGGAHSLPTHFRGPLCSLSIRPATPQSCAPLYKKTLIAFLVCVVLGILCVVFGKLESGHQLKPQTVHAWFGTVSCGAVVFVCCHAAHSHSPLRCLFVYSSCFSSSPFCTTSLSSPAMDWHCLGLEWNSHLGPSCWSCLRCPCGPASGGSWETTACWCGFRLWWQVQCPLSEIALNSSRKTTLPKGTPSRNMMEATHRTRMHIANEHTRNLPDVTHRAACLTTPRAS